MKTSFIDDVFSSSTIKLGSSIDLQMRKAPVIACDEVTEYLYALNDKEVWDITDFPNVAPPFESFWIETCKPSKIQSEQFGELSWESDHLRPSRWGALFHVNDKRNLIKPKKGAILYNEWDLLQFHWLIDIVMFVQRPGFDVMPIWAWSMPITKEGAIWPKHDKDLKQRVSGLSYSIVPDVVKLLDPRAKVPAPYDIVAQSGLPETSPKIHPAWNHADGEKKYDMHRAEAHGYLHPLLLALTFMHCKNTKMKTVHPDAKLRKKRAASGKTTSSYRTIEVGPIKKMLEAAKQPGDSGIQMALHRCRGHFKTYTEDRPLLGHAVGTFFWEDQVRGKKTKGEVKSDYKVVSGE